MELNTTMGHVALLAITRTSKWVPVEHQDNSPSSDMLKFSGLTCIVSLNNISIVLKIRAWQHRQIQDGRNALA